MSITDVVFAVALLAVLVCGGALIYEWVRASRAYDRSYKRCKRLADAMLEARDK